MASDAYRERQKLARKEAVNAWKERNKDKQNGYAKKHYALKIKPNKPNKPQRSPTGEKTTYKHIRIRNRKFVNDYLSTHPCIDCGESDIVVLEFDHIGIGKDLNISAAVFKCWSIDRIKAEIAKCEVRCCNCHRKITAERRGPAKRKPSKGKLFVTNYLLDHPCVDCSENNVLLLEFDHISDKEISIAVAVREGWKPDKLAAEIAKCEVRCCNCHRKVTHTRRQAAKEAGIITWYQ